ncbi:hypothetical protein ABS71_04015 [bacterium SCN 62-11]|nr:MAG: hypothetical protein ABS71_04015 [bacterium SCN 62-11]
MQPLALLDVAVDGIDERGQTDLLSSNFQVRWLFQSLALVEFGEFERQEVRFHLQEQAAEQRGKAGQLRAEPVEPAEGLIHLEGFQSLLHSARSQQQIAVQAGQELMVGTGLLQLLGVDQGFVPALELPQGDGAIEVEDGRILAFDLVQGGQRLLGLLRLQLNQGRLVKPAVVQRAFLMQQVVSLR